MEQLTIQISNMQDVEREIDRSQRKACESFVEIGYILRKADDAQLYKERGYTSISAFAREAYGWDESQTSRFMAINREYSEGGYSATLKAGYEGYGQTKLSEMLKLPDSIREELSPEMKRDDFRDIRKEYEAAEEERRVEEFESSFAPAQMKTEENFLKNCIRGLFSKDDYARRIPKLWKYMMQYEEEKQTDEQSVLMALCPGGFGHARVGSILCFFREKELALASGGRKERYQYADLVRELLCLDENVELNTPQEWYEKVFGRQLPEEPAEKEAKTEANNESPLGEHGSKKDRKDTKKVKKSADNPKTDTNLQPEAAGKDEKGDAPDAANDESPLGDQPLPGQSEIGEFAEEMPITYEKPSMPEPRERQEELKTDVRAAVQSGENDESPLGEHDSEVLPDRVDGVCQFCTGNKDIESNNGTFIIHIMPSGIGRVERKQGVSEFGIIEFEYCPKCGKELGGDEE